MFFNSHKGFTLIEFLVAIVILMVGMLGLLHMVNVSINTNMTNMLRADSIALADEFLARETAKPFDSIAIATVNYSSSRRINNVFKMYSVTQATTAVSANTRNIDIVVSWKYKGNRSTHRLSSLRSR